MLRRTLLAIPFAALAGRAASESLRGRLAERATLDAGGRRVELAGEKETLAVLGDSRLIGSELELIGEFKAPGRFEIGPFYQSKSMFVHRGGKRYTISYWCEICSIRTYTPGICVCCQQETELSLQEFPPR
jgi:hypothetical protein